jgi:hypothetical protein
LQVVEPDGNTFNFVPFSSVEKDVISFGNYG